MVGWYRKLIIVLLINSLKAYEKKDDHFLKDYPECLQAKDDVNNCKIPVDDLIHCTFQKSFNPGTFCLIQRQSDIKECLKLQSSRHILASKTSEKIVINETTDKTIDSLTFCKFDEIHFVSLNTDYTKNLTFLNVQKIELDQFTSESIKIREVFFINSSIIGNLKISRKLSKLTINNSDFNDIIVDESGSIDSVNIFGSDEKRLEIGKLVYYGKIKQDGANFQPSSEQSCQQESHSLFNFAAETGEVKIHYGVLASIVLGFVIAFVIFHFSYRRCKYKAYLAKKSVMEDVIQEENQEIDGPDYYESVNVFNNYHADATRANENDTIYADYAEIK